MKRGKLYGVGVGPGDKELITLKALRILKEADVIAVPVMKNGEKTAYGIVEEHIRDKAKTELYMPMSRDVELLDKSYCEAADKIQAELDRGKTVAFITLGDPTVYSTYMPINEIIKQRGYKTEIIPAVTSFCAAAARLNIPLCERAETLTVVPASYADIEEALKTKGTKVFMKAGKKTREVCEMIKQKGLDKNAYIVGRCGMEGEKLYKGLDGFDGSGGYFSLIIVKEGEQ